MTCTHLSTIPANGSFQTKLSGPLYTPKLATTTPNSLSLVYMSAPVNSAAGAAASGRTGPSRAKMGKKREEKKSPGGLVDNRKPKHSADVNRPNKGAGHMRTAATVRRACHLGFGFGRQSLQFS